MLADVGISRVAKKPFVHQATDDWESRLQDVGQGRQHMVTINLQPDRWEQSVANNGF
jgi:hypothetical protein